jgi:hypothetical protein
MAVSGQLHAAGRNPLDKRLGGFESRSGRGGEEKNPSPCREPNAGHTTPSPVTLITKLPGIPNKLYKTQNDKV